MAGDGGGGPAVRRRAGALDAGYRLLRPWLFRRDAEQAHGLTLATIDRLDRMGLLARLAGPPVADPCTFLGLPLRNRVGLAAGLDKDAAHVAALARFGFGLIELGTVTPRPQPGNPRPRLFRLPAAQALVNRFGFNNIGLDRFLANLVDARRRSADALSGVIVGLNIGKNASTPLEQAADDYRIGLERVSPHADYVTVNISSPNTRDLRRLQGGDQLADLLSVLDGHRADRARQGQRCPPLLLKIAPDLEPAQLEHLVAQVRRFAIDGLIATNTTIDHSGISGLPHGEEAGGVSGAPLRQRSRAVIAALRQALPTGFPIIGVGGILTAADARATVDAGADVVQIYTGLIYRGPMLVSETAAALASGRPAMVDPDPAESSTSAGSSASGPAPVAVTPGTAASPARR